jgi:thiol-disulfide isomerase/thioredoxin
MCGPCQELLPFLNVMDKHFEKDGIDFLKCNVANETVLAQKFKITSVPTTMVIDQDKNIHYVRIGLTDGGSYINEITKIIKKKNKQPGSFTQWLKTLFYGRK